MLKLFGAVVVVALLPVALVLATGHISQTSSAASAVRVKQSGFGETLLPGAVPNGWDAHLMRAAQQCEEISPSLLAAQIEKESGWDPEAVSPVGAIGLAQFMPDTWNEFGVDANGDGIADPRSPEDAIASQAKYMCALVGILREAGLPGTHELLLAAYNAGPGAVVKYKGIPPYNETQVYVSAVVSAMSKYASSGLGLAPGSSSVIAQAEKWKGTPYSWGGGGIGGPSRGFGRGAATTGFDCSSLMQYAFFHGAGITLARTTRQQVKQGQPVPKESLAPGDAIYFAPRGGAVNHVGLYIGNGQMIHAPSTGKKVRAEKIFGNSYWEGKTWHPRRFGG